MSDKQRFCSGCRDDFYNHRETPDGDVHRWKDGTPILFTNEEEARRYWTPVRLVQVVIL